MATQLGIKVYYYKPLSAQYNMYNELESEQQFEKIETEIIYHEFINQRTMKKMGWVNEVDKEHPVAEVAYDIPIMVGGIIQLPSAIKADEWKTYRISSIESIPQFPVSFTCHLAPIYKGDEIQKPALQEGTAMPLHRYLTKTEEDD